VLDAGRAVEHIESVGRRWSGPEENPMTCNLTDTVFASAIDLAGWLVDNQMADGDVRVVVDGVEIDASDLADCDDVDDVRRVIEITLG